MFKTIFAKTLYEKRWMTFWWTFAAFALVLLIAAFFPTLRDSFGASLQDVPDSMKGLLGDASAYQTYIGFMDIQVFEQMVFLPVTLGIILATGILAGEESDGTLQTLLSYPVRRSTVYLHKLAASAVIVGFACTGLAIGTILGGIMVNAPYNIRNILLATLGLWIVSMLLTVLGYALGAITGKRGFSGAIAGLIAFGTYVLTSIVAGVKSLQWLDYASPFHYFQHTKLMDGTFTWVDFGLLILVAVGFAVIGYVIFKKRDIYQH